MEIHIIGAGGLGKELRSMLEALPCTYSATYDRDLTLGHPPPSSIPAGASVAFAIGDSQLRRKAFQELNSQDYDYPSLIHPQAQLQDPSSIAVGEGSVIANNSLLTCDIELGRFVFINLNCTIGHDVKLGDFSSLMPSVNLGGAVSSDEEVYLGTGATVLPGLHLGAQCIVGAGAVVTRDVSPCTTVVGVPARPIST